MSDTFEDRWDEHDRLISSICNEDWLQVTNWLASEKMSLDEKKQIMLTRSSEYIFSTARGIPFHWACFYGAPSEILLEFIDLGGEELALMTDDSYVSNSLIWTATNRVSLDVVKKLISLKEELPAMTNISGDNALHMACKFDQDLLVIQHLVRSGAPFNILQQRNKEFGQLPIHVASSFHSDVRVIKFLLSEDGGTNTIKAKDNEGLSPLFHAYRDGASPEVVDFLVDKSTFTERLNQKVSIRHDNALYMLKWASKQDDKVLKRFLMKPFVRKVLNNYFIQPMYLGTLMCDLYTQIALVWVYSAIDKDVIIGLQSFGSFKLGLIYLGFIWRLIREFLQILTVPLNLYVRDLWNYLDLALIYLTLRTALFFSYQRALTDYEVGVLALSTGFVWFHFILVLSNLRYEVCVFVVALQNVIIKLLPFYITSLIIVFSFGNMFYIANVIEEDLQECWEDPDQAKDGYLCTLQQSYFTTFTMLLSGNWIKFDDPNVTLLTILSMGFAIIIGLILLNILIAEIGSAYGEMREQSRVSFWKNRLSFIGEISLGLSIFPCVTTDVHLEEPEKTKRYNFDEKLGMFIYKDIITMMRNGTMTSEEKVFFLWWNNGKDITTPSFFTRCKIFMRRSRLRGVIIPGRALERLLSGSNAEEKAPIIRIITYLLTPIIWAFLLVLSTIGLVTFGFTWPRNLKKYLFFGPLEPEGSLESDVEAMRKNVTQLQSNIDRLESKIDRLLLDGGMMGESESHESSVSA